MSEPIDHKPSVGDQFVGHVLGQDNPWWFQVGYNPKKQVVFLSQQSGQLCVVFPNPESMEIVAKELQEIAERWKRGDLT